MHRNNRFSLINYFVAGTVCFLISSLVRSFWSRGPLFPFFCKCKDIVQYIVFDKKRKVFLSMAEDGTVNEDVCFKTVWLLMFKLHNKKLSIKHVLSVFGINIRIIEKHRECLILHSNLIL